MISKKLLQSIEAEILKQPNGCWLWLGRTTNGYPVTKNSQGKIVRVCRLIFAAYREPIGGNVRLRHSCGRRDCCNPYHLVPILTKRNVPNGQLTEHRQMAKAKLTLEQINSIRLLRAEGHTFGQLSIKFGVSRQQISRIVRGEQWK